MQIRTVGVLGCGLMGSGIAQVCAQAGYETLVREVDDSRLQQGIGRIEKFLTHGVKRGKVTATARDDTLAKLSGTTSVDDLKRCDLVIEAIVEQLDAKQQVFQGCRGGRRRAGDLALQHLVAVHHRARGGDAAARPLCRATFFQPRCRS